MNNREVCEYVRKLDVNKNCEGKEYISDLCVKQGYGQTCGGYLKAYSIDDLKQEIPSQKEHFLSYYSHKNRIDNMPTYDRLRCPQLLLFIAEIAGISKEILIDAFNIVKNYEEENNIKNKMKDGNYMCRSKQYGDFKKKLHISSLVNIIRKSENWDEVIEKVKKLNELSN